MIGFAGHLRLTATRRASGRTALTQQSFRAPFHVSKPYWDAEAGALLVQVVNPTAGILAGDLLESDISAGPEASLLVTTPSASRVFTMREGTAETRQRFEVAEHGWLEVSPEPLVPHRGCRYRQHTTIEVAAGGGLFFVDQLMPGRSAFEERWAWTELELRLEVRVAGALVLRERFASAGPELKELAAFAGTGPDACFANAVLIAPAADATENPPWRAALMALHGSGTWVGVSALRAGGWAIKIVAPESIRLRATVQAVRAVLAGYFPRMAANLRKL